MLEFVARRGGAVGVVDIGGGLSARRPGEQHRDGRRLRVVGDLGQAIEPLGEHRIEAVNEQENLALSRRPPGELGVQRLDERLVAVEIVFVAHDEIGVGIAGRRFRPFDLAVLMRRRDRDRDLGVVDRAGSVAVEKRARTRVPLARRRDEQGVIDGARRGDGHRAQKAGLRSGGAGNQRHGDEPYRQNGKRSPRTILRAPNEKRSSAQRRNSHDLLAHLAGLAPARACQRPSYGEALSIENEITTPARFPLHCAFCATGPAAP